MTARAQDRTISGFDRSEVVSALQKAIRRNVPENAVYWAAELALSGDEYYVWMRLLVITSEDVGSAWPEGPAVIAALFDAWKQAKGREGERRLFMTDAIVRLCRASKTRVADHLAYLMFEHHETASWSNASMSIPDEALDLHTQRGRRKGRGVDHFIDEAAKVSPKAEDELERFLEPLVRRLAKRSRRVPDTRGHQLPLGEDAAPG
jgi:replication-associated recombination protein RarA